MATDNLKIPEVPREMVESGGNAGWIFVSPTYPKPRSTEGKYGKFWSWGVNVDYGQGPVLKYWTLSEYAVKKAFEAGITKDSVVGLVTIPTEDGKSKELIIYHHGGPMKVWSDAEMAEIIGEGGPVGPVNQAPTLPTSGGNNKPVAPPVPPPAATSGQPPKPPQPPQQNEFVNTYKLFSDEAKAAWLQAFEDRANLVIQAQAMMVEKAKLAGLDELSPDQVSAMATSAIIETWRFFGAKGGVDRWVPNPAPVEPVDLTTKEGAMTAIANMLPTHYPDASTYAWKWLEFVADAHSHYGDKRHAANAAKLFGIDSAALFSETDTAALVQFTLALWDYADARDEDVEQDEALKMVAEKYYIPNESLKLNGE